jgi:hypothetical protein
MDLRRKYRGRAKRHDHHRRPDVYGRSSSAVHVQRVADRSDNLRRRWCGHTDHSHDASWLLLDGSEQRLVDYRDIRRYRNGQWHRADQCWRQRRVRGESWHPAYRWTVRHGHPGRRRLGLARAEDSKSSERRPPGRGTRRASVWRRSLNMVDHQDLHRVLRGFQFEPELFLQCCED